MAMVLDTDDLPVADRAEAVICAMRESFVPFNATPEGRDNVLAARMDSWAFGSASIVRSALSGIQLRRTARQARSYPSATLAIAMQETGAGLWSQDGDQHMIGTGELIATDQNLPHSFRLLGRGTSSCLFVPLDQLGLSHDLIRVAGPRLQTSPIYSLMVDHIAGLTRHAEALSTDPAAAGLGVISVDLVRALLVSAASDTCHRRDALAATLLTQIRVYVRRHLDDPDLTPEMIAAAHNVSVRHLYKVCAAADFSLHQWMTSERLRGARDELAALHSRHRSIAVIAQRWGFANPTHFGRRFRAAYGMTPREWRRMAPKAGLVDNFQQSG